jgi:homocysteine S-methyltransferase
MLRSPIESILSERGCVVLDGALATELERAGCDLRDPLWSAKVLIEAPEKIRAVHASYFAAGADCATSATYQATFEGFAKRGLDTNEALAMFQRAVDLAVGARDEFWSDPERRAGRSKPFVAASIGSYGAYLADGSEYRGDYGLDVHALLEFHLPRMAVLASSGAEVFALETIPSLLEARALVRALRIVRDMPAWLSFSCRDGEHTCHGERIADCVAEVAGCEQLVAIGINCTAPRYVESLIREVRGATSLPIVAYPNSGERFDAATHSWSDQPDCPDFAAAARGWFAAGARLIGGCCRTTPQDIRRIAAWRGSVAKT